MSLSSLDYETIVTGVLIVLAYGYAAFWALNIRRKLNVRLYRHQALGIGLVAISLAYFTFFLDGAGSPSLLPAAASQFPWDEIFVTFLACPFTLLYWTDSSLLAARDADPLQRDVLGWGRIRNTLLGAVGISLLAGGVYTTYQIVFLTQATIQAGSSVYLVGLPSILNFIAVFVPLLVPFAVGPIFLPMAARRTKDLTLRQHLKWFGLGAVFLVLGLLGDPLEALTGGSGGTVNSFVEPIYFLVFLATSAYCLYRSARAVIPIYSLKGGDQ